MKYIREVVMMYTKKEDSYGSTYGPPLSVKWQTTTTSLYKTFMEDGPDESLTDRSPGKYWLHLTAVMHASHGNAMCISLGHEEGREMDPLRNVMSKKDGQETET